MTNFDEEFMKSKCASCASATRKEYINTTLLYCNAKKVYWTPKIELRCESYEFDPYWHTAGKNWNLGGGKLNGI